MATLQSLGLHEPSALPYLISEGLLKATASPSSYKWHYQQAFEAGQPVVDEILWTPSCVVWSRNAVIKRVFNLDVEGETIVHALVTSFEIESSLDRARSPSVDLPVNAREHGLVVILKTQAHIFLLSGDTHLLPLGFKVQKAIPAAYGFFLQRSMDTGQSDLQEHSVNTFPPATAEETSRQFRHSLVSQFMPPDREESSKLPRTFAFPELLSEISLVVSGSSRKREALEQCPPLSLDEEIVYVSTQDELQELQSTNSEKIHLAVTANPVAGVITLWQVRFKQSNTDDATGRRKAEKPGRASKRKSSNIYARQAGVATPVARIPGTFRDSFGVAGQSIPETSLFPSGRDMPPSPAVDLAASLGHEFEQVGVQTRSARRVSSMLARTDLSGANDRSAFNDMAFGTAGRKSFGRGVRRGESLGGFSDRQSFGTRRRSSFQAASSMYSDGTSFLDLPASHFLDDGIGQSGANGLDEFGGSNAASKLPKDVGLMKLKSLPYQFTDRGNGEDQALKVVTMIAPDRSTADDRRSRIISVCIMDKKKREMTIVNVAAKLMLSAPRHKSEKVMYDLKAVEVQRGQSIVDACKIVDDSTKRLLILTQTREGQSVLHLEAPWSASYRVDLPTHFKVFGALNHSHTDSPTSRRETGIRRVMPATDINLLNLHDCDFADQVLVLDSEHRSHRLRFSLVPAQAQIRNILQMCNFVLAPEFSDSLLVTWWEVKRWIESQGPEVNIEWTALTVTLFVLAVPFISGIQTRPAQGPRRRKGGLLRSSSGTTVDLTNWGHMQEAEANSIRQSWSDTPTWGWMSVKTPPLPGPISPSRHSRNASVDEDSKQNTFLIRCVNLTRDFLQSPAGESAIGPEGYLPTAVGKDRVFRRTALASILVGLHLVREEAKLSELSSPTPSETSDNLAVTIAQIASWLGWQGWRADPGQYYHTEIKDRTHWLFETSTIDTLETPAQPFTPPSIFLYVETAIVSGDQAPFPSLLDLVSQTRSMPSSHPLWKAAAQITPRLFAITTFITGLNTKSDSNSVIEHMLQCGIDDRALATLPAGIAAVCQRAILAIRAQPPAVLSVGTKSLLGRADLDVSDAVHDSAQNHSHVNHFHEALRDHRTISNSAIDAEAASRWDASSELDRQTVTRLIFHEDRRFQEASKLVNQTRPPVVECTPEPEWSESDLLDAQKELAVHVTRRTLSVAAGRAMMHFNARVPLLTERVPIPAFSLQCVMKPRDSSDNTQPLTFSADKALFTEDKVCWAFFHNGASAGLMISKDTQWIDTSWILYNKPPELTNRHAGFLLALGLNGHLKSLAKWVAFKYLTPKHTMTSIGLLLGLAASYLGTMDTLVTRLLSVHVTRLLPVGAAELNLSPLTQTTGIMGIGLLYHNSQHRRMSEVMLSEIENSDSEDRSGDEPILRDEGYRLAAGFSLGLINLGQGRKLHSLHEMGVIERLLTIAIGTKNVNLVHVLDRATAGAVIAIAFIFMKTNDQAIAQKIDVPDTTHQFDYVRPDIFLLRTLARHLIMWDNIVPTRDFIQSSLPRIHQKRVNLSTTRRLSTDDLPLFNVIAGICFAMSLRFAGSHRSDARDLLVLYLDQFLRLSKLPALNYDAKVTLNGVRNCLDVLALSSAIVMAGTGDIIVMRRLRALHARTDKETPFGSHLAAHMALGVLFLSGGTATFGTNNLAIAALVISLYPLFPVTVLDNKGHLQALRHLWVLAVENRCLIARDVDTRQIISEIEARVELINGDGIILTTPGLLPEFDKISRVSFQHESYWPVIVEFDSPSDTISNMETFKSLNGQPAPKTVRERLQSSGKGLRIFLQRRAVYEKPETDVFFSELQALDEARGVPSVDVNSRINEKWRQLHSHVGTSETTQNKDAFEWIFELNAFKKLDFAERALVLDDTGSTISGGRRMIKETPVDSRLDFENGCLDLDDRDDDDDNDNDDDVDNGALTGKRLPMTTMDKDKLWQLRLLFDWTSRWDREEEQDGGDTTADASTDKRGARWMKKEVVEQLRWRVWRMAGRLEGE